MQQNMMGQNIIITEPSSNLRALGRNALAGKWKIAIIAVIVYQLCILIPPAILNSLFGVSLGDVYLNNGGYDSMYYQYSYMYDSMPSYSFLSSIYLLLVTGAFTLGVTIFFLALFRRQIVGVSDIFLGFERFGKALGLMLFQGLFIFLWMLLFIVPGIIAAIRYSQAFFVLADDPDKSIRECMNESKRMMKGNKGKYFCMSISFIGWALLSAIPSGIIESVAGLFGLNTFSYILVSVISSLFMVPVSVYIFSTQAGFYEILAGHLIKETAPAPVMHDMISDAFKEPVQDKAEAEDKTFSEAMPSADSKEEESPEEKQTAEPDKAKESSTIDVADVFAEAESEQKKDK